MRRSATLGIVFFAIVLGAAMLWAQAPQPAAAPPASSASANPWTALEFLLGTWSGSGPGQPGKVVSGTCSFSYDLNRKVMVRSNHAEISPAVGNGPTQLHDDLLIVYQEQGESILRAIYFDNEGHTIHYTVAVSLQNRVVFESAGDENTPRFRLTHALQPDGTLSTEFAIAPPGGQFAIYTQGVTKRVK